MDTLAKKDFASIDTEPDLHLLLEHDSADDWRRWRAAGTGTLIAHIVAVLLLLAFKGGVEAPRREEIEFKPLVTKLYTPPELTQRAANRAPISKEIAVPSVPPQPVLRAPAPSPAPKASAPAPSAPASSPLPPAPKTVPQAQPTVKPTVPEPPKIEAQNATGQSAIAQINPLQPVEKPKLVLENAAPPPKPSNVRPSGSLMPPSNSVQDAIRDLARGNARAGLSVGDAGGDQGGIGPGLNLPPSAGRPRSSLELKSDPMGVDFRPYLLQALQAVRRNWFAVYPEAARLGQRGQVVLQFSIIRQGTVTKVIYTTESGSRALDQAAVAAVSASNPLPPLPSEFKGDRIILQMTFLYNMPR